MGYELCLVLEFSLRISPQKRKVPSYMHWYAIGTAYSAYAGLMMFSVSSLIDLVANCRVFESVRYDVECTGAVCG